MLRTTQELPYSSKINILSDWTWVHTFILLQFILQILLLFPQFAVLRIPMRTASFGLSLFLLVRLWGREAPKHPATSAVLWVLVILGLQFCLHPTHSNLKAALAQCMMYVAIVAPLFWVTRLKITAKGFEKLIFLLWGFHTLSAGVGLLQVYFPGQFQPALSTTIENGQWGGEHLLITLANGQTIYRPMGLTDIPGGAAGAGFYAFLFSAGIALKTRNPLLRLVCLGSGAVGLFCIYLSQIRSILVFAAISIVCFAVILARTGQFFRSFALSTGVTTLFLGTFTWAVAIGGKSTLERIHSLFAHGPSQVYYENHGHFLEHTFQNLLPQYPLGAGLGRWGQIGAYFGDGHNSFIRPLWVEIQWTGWLYDGGVPLIIAYVAALYFACYTVWKIAMSRQLDDFRLWGGLIFAYDIGSLAITFNYPLFISQTGMEFWLLNTVLFVAACHSGMQWEKPDRRIL